MKTKRFKLDKNQSKDLEKIFLQVDEKCRLSYVYASCIIQTIGYNFYNKKIIPIEKIHKWFLTDYFINQYINNNQVDFFYLSIASEFLKQKLNFDLLERQDEVLSKINLREIRVDNKEAPFTDLEKYCEYVANRGMKHESEQNQIYNFVVKKE